MKNSLKNSFTAISFQVITMLLSFIVRTVFIKTLGIDYLGINGLFSNILSMLSLSELGVGTAIIYSMYKPFVEKDYNKICLLIRLYGRIYISIGIIIIFGGCLLIPFLDSFIADKPNIPYLGFYFLIYVLDSASSYFFIYKTSILTVDQKEYVISSNKMVFAALKYTLELFVLLIFENYVLFLLSSLFTTLIGNIFIAHKAKKKYPYINEKPIGNLSKEERKSLIKNISALFFHRIGNVVVNGTDNIVISKVFGIGFVGIYSNYLLIIMSINTLMNLMFNSITASVGNLNVTENIEKKFEVYKNLNFANHWISGFSCICLFLLLNPFITLWLGIKYIFDIKIVFVLSLNFYFLTIRKTNLIFRNAMGLFWKDRYKPLLESLINLFFSVLLAYKIGIVGVFIGTLISSLSTCFWIEPLILFKFGFNIKLREYFKMFSKHFSIIIIVFIVSWIVANAFNSNTIIVFIYKMIVCLIIPNLLFYVLYYRSSEMKYYRGLLREFIKRKQ